MNTKAENFTAHPEGGRYREIHRSPHHVRGANGKNKSALTHIYFQLRKGEVSRFHKVEQEEIWNLYQGALTLWIYNEKNDTVEEIRLSSETNTFCAVVPAGCWQAAEPESDEALMGCTVAPGFDFEDFTLIDPHSAISGILSERHLERFL